jgi:hypothetical protein
MCKGKTSEVIKKIKARTICGETKVEAQAMSCQRIHGKEKVWKRSSAVHGLQKVSHDVRHVIPTKPAEELC